MDPTRPLDAEGESRPTLFCLHWLGGSRETWAELASALTPFVDVVSVDLPGFGDAAHREGQDVETMAAGVVAAVRARAPRRWMLAGHSMGAKVALAVAKAAESRQVGLEGLSHLVVLAGSPPAPEPMAEDRRAAMLSWFAGDSAQSRREAQAFVDGNVGAALEPEINARVVADVLRVNRHAWTSWLEGGSREDWADRIGTLQTPALVVAGAADGDLGPDGQRRLMMRHFATARFEVLPGAGHLLPVERAETVADLVLRHIGLPGLAAAGAPYRALIASDRVAARTRSLLVRRATADDPHAAPRVLTTKQMAVLRALVARLIPQRAEESFDIAACVDRDLAEQPGDGWRFADLPPDIDAYRQGLDTVEGEAVAEAGGSFASRDAETQDRLITALSEGRLATAGQLSGAQMKLWLQDLCANAVRIHVSHPATLARLGYSGIGYGGDGERLQGFHDIGIGRVEPWEPAPHRVSTP